MIIPGSPCGEQGNREEWNQYTGHERAGSHMEVWGSVYAGDGGKPPRLYLRVIPAVGGGNWSVYHREAAWLFEVYSKGCWFWMLWPALHAAHILLRLGKLSGREVLGMKMANAEGLWAGHWLPLLLILNKLVAQNWMAFAKSYKKCQVTLRPEVTDFYSPPADVRSPQLLLCQDRVIWGQCHPWKQPQGSFSSNSITFGMSPMPRLCYRCSNKSAFCAFFFFNQATWHPSRDASRGETYFMILWKQY